MRGYPYLIENLPERRGKRLRRIDPRKGEFDERWLQDILIAYPDLLPTAEIEPIFHPLLVIGREVQVAGGRIDVLYISTSGYPVIVETKLWRNPESRREVVAQVLDLSLAFSKWEYDHLEKQAQLFTGKYEGKELSFRELLEARADFSEVDYSEFRETAERNLRLGRFLVAVVGDKIHASSREILESLNRYPGLGLKFALIEIECFTFDGEEGSPLILVPRIAKKSEIIERSIVEVRISKDKEEPEVEITQDKTIKVGPIIKRPSLTELEFWDRLKLRAPKDYDKVKEFCQEYQEKELIRIVPGTNGLIFRQVLSDYNRFISLFYITTDAHINVKLQAPRQQFSSLSLDTRIVEEFGENINKVLRGFRAPIGEIDVGLFNKIVSDFTEAVNQLETGS